MSFLSEWWPTETQLTAVENLFISYKFCLTAPRVSGSVLERSHRPERNSTLLTLKVPFSEIQLPVLQRECHDASCSSFKSRERTKWRLQLRSDKKSTISFSAAAQKVEQWDRRQNSEIINQPRLIIFICWLTTMNNNIVKKHEAGSYCLSHGTVKASHWLTIRATSESFSQNSENIRKSVKSQNSHISHKHNKKK